MQDSGSLGALSRCESLRLLATSPIGRVIFTQNALPAIRLVNFVLDSEMVVFRTGPGGKLAVAVHHSVVAFEADEVDAATHTGWTVTVIGVSQEVTDPAELRRLRSLPLRSWAPGPKDHLVGITTELVSGRRLWKAPGIPPHIGNGPRRGSR